MTTHERTTKTSVDTPATNTPQEEQVTDAVFELHSSPNSQNVAIPSDKPTLSQNTVMQLQSTIGNNAVQRLMTSSPSKKPQIATPPRRIGPLSIIQRALYEFVPGKFTIPDELLGAKFVEGKYYHFIERGVGKLAAFDDIAKTCNISSLHIHIYPAGFAVTFARRDNGPGEQTAHYNYDAQYSGFVESGKSKGKMGSEENILLLESAIANEFIKRVKTPNGKAAAGSTGAGLVEVLVQMGLLEKPQEEKREKETKRERPPEPETKKEDEKDEMKKAKGEVFVPVTKAQANKILNNLVPFKLGRFSTAEWKKLSNKEKAQRIKAVDVVVNTNDIKAAIEVAKLELQSPPDIHTILSLIL